MFCRPGAHISSLLASSSLLSMAMATTTHPISNSSASVHPVSDSSTLTSTTEIFSSNSTLPAGHVPSSPDSTVSEYPFPTAGSGTGSPIGNGSCPICYQVDNAYLLYYPPPTLADIITQTVVPYVTEFEDGSRTTRLSTLTVTRQQSTAASDTGEAAPTEDPDNFWSELNAASVTVNNDEFEYDGYTFTISSIYSAQISDASITYFSPIDSGCFTGVLSGGLSPVYPDAAASTEIPRDVNALIEQAQQPTGTFQQPLAPWTSCSTAFVTASFPTFTSFEYPSGPSPISSEMQWAASLTQTTVAPTTVTQRRPPSTTPSTTGGPHLESPPESGGGPALPINEGGSNRPNGGDGQGEGDGEAGTGGGSGNGGYPVSNGSGDRQPGNSESSGSDSSPDSSPYSHIGSTLLCALGNQAACADSRPANSPSPAQAALTAGGRAIPAIRLDNGALLLDGSQTVVPGPTPATINGEVFSFPSAPASPTATNNDGSQSGPDSGAGPNTTPSPSDNDDNGDSPSLYTFLASANAPLPAQTLSFPALAGVSSGSAGLGLAAATQTLTASNGAVLTAVVPSGSAEVLTVNGVEVSLGGPSATVDGVRVGLETNAAQTGGGEVEIGVEVVGNGDDGNVSGNGNGDGRGNGTAAESRGWRLGPGRRIGAGIVLLGLLLGR